MNTKKRQKVQKEKDEIGENREYQHTLSTNEQLGKKTENGKRIGGERIGPKITEKKTGKSASLCDSKENHHGTVCPVTKRKQYSFHCDCSSTWILPHKKNYIFRRKNLEREKILHLHGTTSFITEEWNNGHPLYPNFSSTCTHTH